MKKTLHFLLLMLFFAACQKNEFISREDINELPGYISDFEAFLNLPPVTASYQRQLPRYLTAVGMVVVPTDDAKVTLGRVLFYDKNLSLDRKIACASCHHQAQAFSDNVAVSRGINGLNGTRNAMPLANVASFSAHYSAIDGVTAQLLWDNRAADVAQQATLAFLNDHEMGMTLDGVVERVKEQTYYPYLWQKVYGNLEVREDQVLECLTAFVGAIGASDSRFDQSLEAANGNINLNGIDTTITIHQIYSGNDSTLTLLPFGLPGFTTSENRGRDIFIANCSKCHSPIRPFQEVQEACNGLDLNYLDQGKGKLTGNPADVGVFKTPSLRNIELTAPYMHDGRFATLEQVVAFYSTGVKAHPNLHPEMTHNGSIQLNLTNQQKSDLIAFLKTLTDRQSLLDERFADPFRH